MARGDRRDILATVVSRLWPGFKGHIELHLDGTGAVHIKEVVSYRSERSDITDPDLFEVFVTAARLAQEKRAKEQQAARK